MSFGKRPPVMPENKMLMAALRLARKGMHVFPLKLNKHPRTPNGFKDATTDYDEIISWWIRWPTAPIGIRTGKASGFDALDIDDKENRQNGKPDCHGSRSLRKLEKKYGSLPETYEVRTASGSTHLYFQATGVPCCNKLKDGIDWKGEGGYVVAPPSYTDDGDYRGFYEVIADRVVAKAPSWLVKIARSGRTEVPSTKRSGLRSPATSDSGRKVDTKFYRPAGELPDVIPTGERESRLLSFANSLRAKGAGPRKIAKALAREDRKRCKPPLQEENPAKAERFFDSCVRNACKKPAGARA